MQIGFLSNCTHTLIVHWSAGVRIKCRNTSSLAMRLIQVRSFKRVFFALISMLRDSEPSSSRPKSLHGASSPFGTSESLETITALGKRLIESARKSRDDSLSSF